MKVWKKLSAVTLALAVAMVLCVTAFAVGEATLTNGVAKNSTTDYATISNVLNIPKSIHVTGSVAKVYGPTVTYSYNIAGADISGAPTVNDGTHTARPVKVGVTDGVTLSTVAFASSELTLDGGSYDVTENLTATVNLSKFTAPGIYRYEITENTGNTALLYSAGVTRPKEDHFFLDVYIKNDNEEVGGVTTEVRKVYGFVLLNANESITTDNAGTYKVSTLTTDEYRTMDISVTKNVTGDMGDKNHEFPFTIAVTNNGLKFYSGEGSVDAEAADTTSLSANLKNGESFVIKGLNPKATVMFTETNDTPDEYTVNVTGATSAVTGSIAASGTKSTSALPVSNYDTVNRADNVATVPTASNSAITFTNNLDAISPTGVALRYAPYLAMMGAGVVALPLTHRKKEEEV